MTSSSTKRLKYLVAPRNRKLAYSEADRPYIGLEDIESWTGRLFPGERTEPEGTVSLYEAGDVLFGKLRPYLAKVHLAEETGSCSTEAIVFRAQNTMIPAYLKYVLLDKKRIDEINASTFGAQMPRASWDFISNCKILVPDLNTQKSIVAFLDRQTAGIDLLIKKKELFQETINVKRRTLTTSVINGSLLHNTVRAGQVRWFGDLPAHWPVKRARFLFHEHIDLSQDGIEELLTVSHITGVTSRSDKIVNMFMADTLEGYKIVQIQDLVVNTMWAWMGAIGVSPIIGCVSPSYAVYRPKPGTFYPLFLDLLVRSAPFVAEVNRRSKGIWGSRLRLYPDAFMDIAFPMPPLDEQERLVSKLRETLKREEQIAEKCRQSITLLKERRSALVTAAVGGEIDIRDMTASTRHASTDRARP